MGGFDSAFKQDLIRNAFPMYAVGVFLITLRYIARIRQDGLRGLRSDDYLMLLVLAWYTLLVVMLYVIVNGGGSNLAYPDEYASFTPEEVEERVLGSKLVVVSEQAMLNVIYTLKACLLILYSRLTHSTKYHRLVIFLSIYVVIGFLATEIGFFAFCRPFNGYWAVPPPNPQCTTLQHYAINQAVWNLSSDVGMLFIPLPLLWELKTPLKQKVVLSLVFTLGIYVIIAAILTKTFNLSDVYDTSYMLWYLREASVAVYVANLPILWPLLRDWFPFLRAGSPTSGREAGGPTPYASLGSRRNRRSTWRGGVREMEMGTLDGVVMDGVMGGEKRGEMVGMQPLSPVSNKSMARSSAGDSMEIEKSMVTSEQVVASSPLRSHAPSRSQWEINVETGFDVRSSACVSEAGRKDDHFGGYYAY